MSTQLAFLQEGILEEGVGGHLEGQSPGVRNPGLCSVTWLYFLLDQGKRPPNRCRSLWAECWSQLWGLGAAGRVGPWCSSPVGPTASADGVTALEACVSWAPAAQVPLSLLAEVDSDLSALSMLGL